MRAFALALLFGASACSGFLVRYPQGVTTMGRGHSPALRSYRVETRILHQGSVPSLGPECKSGRGESPAEVEAVDLNRTVLRLQQILASEDPEEIFASADADGSGDLSFEEWERAFGDKVDRAALETLFEEMDSNKDGKMSWQEFKDGLDSMPTAGELDVMMGVLQQMQLDKRMAQHLISITRVKMKRGEEMMTDAVREHMQIDDISAMLEASKREAEERAREYFEMLEQALAPRGAEAETAQRLSSLKDGAGLYPASAAHGDHGASLEHKMDTIQGNRYDNVACVGAVNAEQAAAEMSSPFTGTKATDTEYSLGNNAVGFQRASELLGTEVRLGLFADTSLLMTSSAEVSGPGAADATLLSRMPR